MDSIWLNFISFLSIYIFAIVSPGPNFFLVVDKAVGGSRKEGLLTALGVATGSGLFGLAGMLGLLVLVNSLPNFSLAIRLLGGGYLVWLGFSMVRKSVQPKAELQGSLSIRPAATSLAAWRIGLLTNLTNPKAWAFYFALFTVVITPDFQPWHKVVLNSAMFLISFSWYALVALLLSSSRFRPTFQRVQPVIQLVLGILLIGLGGRIFVKV